MRASDHRAVARQGLKGRWLLAVAVGLVASLVGAAGDIGPKLEFNYEHGQGSVSLGGLPFQDNEALLFIGSMALILTVVILLVNLILGSVISVGYARFNLDLVTQKEDLRPGVLLDYFPHFKNAFLARFFTGLFTVLWALLLIIPGILASYSYAMVPYLLAEDPSLSWQDTLRMSKEMMYGHRFELFCLQLSFIGWSILCLFTLGIGNLFLNPYIQAATASFFLNLRGEGPQPRLEEEVVW